MLVLGLLLVVLSAAATVLLVVYNSSGGPEQMIVLFGRDLVSVTPLQAFLSGIAVALVFALGVWMVNGTNRRMREARAEYRAVRREARQATAERDKLARELAREQERHTDDTAAPAAAAPAAAPAPSGVRGLGRRFRRPRRTDEVSNEESTSRPLGQ